MQIIALAASLLFTSSLSMTVSDTIWAARSSLAGTSAATPTLRGKQAIAYGPDKLQRLDFWPAPEETAKGAPLVVFVHGGGWKRGDKQMMDGSAKLKHWQSLGYAVASVNYRLVPENSVEDQAADIAAAVAHLKKRAGTLGFDPAKVALVGHSAGAHLVALIGTDPAYFKASRASRWATCAASCRSTAPAYNVAEQIDGGARIMHETYIQAFGTEPARQKRLSPTLQAAAPNAPEFLILHVQRQGWHPPEPRAW